MSTTYGDRSSGRTANGARVLSIIAFVLAAISLLFFPVIFGPAAMICGGIAWARGDRLGPWATAAGLAGLVLGMVLGAIVYNAMKS
jgi:hypothetical protein